jgi:hypothetical protein
MKRGKQTIVSLATLSVVTLAIATSSALAETRVGTLTCIADGQASAPDRSSWKASCEFVQSAEQPSQRYEGEVLDWTHSALGQAKVLLLWAVFADASKIDSNALVGRYVVHSDRPSVIQSDPDSHVMLQSLDPRDLTESVTPAVRVLQLALPKV